MNALVKPPEEFEFLEKLSFLLDTAARLKVAYGGRGAGKCLALGTRVIMADGSLRAVENVWPGESLMGPDSNPRKVLGTTRGVSQMYRISQTSGIDYVVNSAHILSLKKSESCKKDKGELSKAGNYRRPGGRYSSYADITNINVVEAFNKPERWKSHFRGYKAGLLKFKTKEIYIDPWYLGAWLGDGKSTDTVLYSMDEEVKSYCEQYAEFLGLGISYYSQGENNKSVGIKIKKINGIDNVLVHQFQDYNLFNNKHIPDEFKFNSEKIRLALLAGLLDTDGHCRHNGYSVSQVNERLARDIKFLADSLGFRTNFRKHNTICSNNGVKGIAYKVSIDGDTWRIPCRIKRKQIKKEDVRKNKDFLLSQIKIEPIGEGEYAGFSLDGDHLFLLEDGTVTHNTEGFVIAAILLSRTKKLRILCGREFQNSIDESVKQTIEANIISMGLEHEFLILGKQIIHKKTGSRFFFMGLRYNINKIKSLGRVDICWIEEADKTSKNTLDKLFPTIRGRSRLEKDRGGPFGVGPEIWISFNPDLDDDEVYKRYVLEKIKYAPEYVTDEETGERVRYAIVVKINYWDNKWFPPDLRMEMNVTKSASEDKYLEVWEGHTKQVLEGAIYAEELRTVIKEGRRGSVPYDPSKPVFTFWDLGHSDKTAIWFIQRVGMEFNLINYYEDRLKKLPHYLEYMQSLKYVYGRVYQPHDAENETLASRSIVKMTREAGYTVTVVQRPAKKVLGINAARTVMPLCNFDEANTSEGWQCLSRYAYKVDDDTGNFSREPLHDVYSNGADAFQTFALSLKTETDSKKPKKLSDTRNNLNSPRSNSWMGSM